MDINLPKLEDKVNELATRAGEAGQDFKSTVADTLMAYDGGRLLKTKTGHDQMSARAMAQVMQIIGLPATVLEPFEGSPELQRAMVQYKLGALAEEDKKKKLICRGVPTADGGTLFQAIFTRDYVEVSNVQLLEVLIDVFSAAGVDARVHKAQIYQRQMHLRIVAPEWYHDLGGNDPAYTALTVTNDEIGLSRQAGIVIRLAVARVSCFNYTITDKPIFEHAHRNIGYGDLVKAIGDGINGLNDAAGQIAGRLRDMKNTTVADVAGMIKSAGTDLGLPAYAINASTKYWEDSGATPNLFQAIQAVQFGVDAMTERKGYHWDRRELAEVQMWNMGQKFQETGKLELCQCPRCHRPMNTLGEGDGDFVEAEYTIQ